MLPSLFLFEIPENLPIIVAICGIHNHYYLCVSKCVACFLNFQVFLQALLLEQGVTVC